MKRELNADLLAQAVLPEVDKLLTEGKITDKDSQEFLDLLKVQLAEGNQLDWNDPPEKRVPLEARRKRMGELSDYLRDLGHRVSGNGNSPADRNYDKIFDLLIREETRREVEQIGDRLGTSLTPELQERIGKLTQGIIHPNSHWRTSPDKREVALDLRKIPFEDFRDLGGLERWPIVKSFSESSGVISRDTFENVEMVVIQRLFDEQLFPGGRESFDGTSAATKMGDLGNPGALPLMLRHIEAYGSGHTSNAVVYEMERLLKESDSEALQKVLEVQSINKRLLLQALGDENSYMNRFGRVNSRYLTCSLLQNGDVTIAREKLAKILEKSGILDEGKVRGFYLGHSEDFEEALAPLLKVRAEVETVIVESKLNVWIQSADKLLAALVNPKYGESVVFPKRIIREGLGISDEKMLAVVDHIFSAKTFKDSGFEREAFLDGLILLNSKEDGKAVLETLLTAYRGSRDDPKRMRRVFQGLSMLEGFGEYGFTVPNPDEAARIQQDILHMQDQLAQASDKMGRKKIKNGIETLEAKLQNVTGLKGIEEAMTQRAVESACRKLDLPAEYQQKITENFETLLKSGVFDIVPSLASKYDSKNEVEVRQLLRVITERVIDGTFHSWRYEHERSNSQLSGLSDEQKEFWKNNSDPISIDIELTEDESGRRDDELKAAQEIIRNAKEHILDFQPNFDFSKKRFDTLNEQVREITEKIKLSSSEDEKMRLISEKRTLLAEATLIGGVLGIEMATPKSYTREKMLTQARELGEKILELNIPLAGLDIEQMKKIFTVGDIEGVIAYESDDPITLLKVGVEPQETCQSWRNGSFNECLLSYVADSNKKVLNVADRKGKIIARSIIKLTDQREENDFESKTRRKTLLVEKPYSLLPNSEVYRVFVRTLLAKARGLDISITFGSGFGQDALKIFEEEALLLGYAMREGKLDLYIPRSLNKYEYSDMLGGKISQFDRYLPRDVVTFEKARI